MKEIHQELMAMYEVYATNPNFGIRFDVEDSPDTIESLRVSRTEDNVKIIDVDDGLESLAAYAIDGFGKANEGEEVRDRAPTFNEELGLAMEPLPEGYTTKNLWLLF